MLFNPFVCILNKNIAIFAVKRKYSLWSGKLYISRSFDQCFCKETVL